MEKSVEVFFTDSRPERLRIYKNGFGYFMKPLFHDAKQVTPEIYKELDKDVLNSNMDYDSFFEKYYNNF